MGIRKIGELELSTRCGECKEPVEFQVDVEHDCDPGCCCGECYSYYLGGYDVKLYGRCSKCELSLEIQIANGIY